MPADRTPPENYLAPVKERAADHAILPLVGLHRRALEYHSVSDMASCAGMYDRHSRHIKDTLPGYLSLDDGPETLLGTTKKLCNALSTPAHLTRDLSKYENALSVRYKELDNARKREANVYEQARLLLRRGEQGRPEGQHLLESLAVSYEAAAVVVDERLALLMLQNRLEDMLGHVSVRISSVDNAYRHARLINYACGLRIEEAMGVRLPAVARGPTLTRKRMHGPPMNRIPVAPPQPPMFPAPAQPAAFMPPQAIGALPAQAEWANESDHSDGSHVSASEGKGDDEAEYDGADNSKMSVL
jgi:hypothetical protein